MDGAFTPLGITVTLTAAAVDTRNGSLVDGLARTPDSAAFKHLSMLATWFSKPGHEHCAIAFLHKSQEFINADDMDVLDKHFALANHCSVFYRWRDSVPGALEGAIAACEMSIEMHERAAMAAKEFFGMIPAHACFRQLRIIEEKRGNFDRAIELCEMAKAGGWADDWDHAIARIEKKKAKAEAK
ncbi:hypothetical protein WBP06_09325 [Novosphingobium sp. BL-8H]|uniref:hypothetical protein n=1 Tax=Novosphingobium sp. BL-8H TaxID=3127640 RepID=UPI003757790C